MRELSEELRELNHTLKEADRSQERYTVILMLFAFVQVLVAVFQFLSDILDPYIHWLGIALLAALSVGMVWVYRSIGSMLPDRSLWKKGGKERDRR
jgi:hypothetical protein